jgi:hypothetical protein
MAAKSKSSKSRASSANSKTTTDHEEIRQWAEARGGQPSCVKGTGGDGDTGLLRIDFPGFSGEDSLEPIEWEEFFEKFDDQGLALVYQEITRGGEPSNFNKLVSRETAAAKSRGSSGRSSSRGGKKSAGRSSSSAKSRSASSSKGRARASGKSATKTRGAAKSSSRSGKSRSAASSRGGRGAR